MKEFENKGKETKLYKLINEYKDSFLEVKTGLRLDEKVGFGVCPAAHQGTGEFPFTVIPLKKKEDGTTETFIPLQGVFPQWYDFEFILNFHKDRGWPNFQGHEIVTPKLESKDEISHFVSFWMHPDGFDLNDLTEEQLKTQPLYPAYANMPKDIFRGGLTLSLAKLIDKRNYINIVTNSPYAESATKYLEYMRKEILEHFRKTGIPDVNNQDIKDIEFSEDLDAKLIEEFPSWKMKTFENSWEEKLLTQVRSYSNELHRLKQFGSMGSE